MDGYLGLFLETGNPTFYMMAKQGETHAGENRDQGPRAAGNTDQRG